MSKKWIFLAFAMVSLSVEGTGIKKVFLPQFKSVYIPTSYSERYITLDKKNFPRVYDPVKFNHYKDLFLKNQVISLAHQTLLNMIRTESLAQFYSTIHFSDPFSQKPEKESGLIVYDKKAPSLSDSADVDQIISFMKEEKTNRSIQFIVFAYLLHNEKISDSEVVKFIDFMDLPKDFVFMGKNLKNLKEINFLDSYFDQIQTDKNTNKDQNLIEEDENKHIQAGNEKYVRELFENNGALLENYKLTTLFHEVVASPRTSLIDKMAEEQTLNPLAKDQLDNSFLHTLGHNPRLTAEEWENILFYLTQNPEIDFNMQNNEGSTFLSTLAESGFTFPIELLIDRVPEADIYIRDIYNRSVFQIAAERLRSSIASYLYHIGGDRLNEISYLNGYVLKNFQSVVLEPVSYFYPLLITEPLKQAIEAKHEKSPVRDQLLVLLEQRIGDHVKALLQYEKLREQALQTAFLRGGLPSDILLAIREGNISFLEKIFLKEKRGLSYAESHIIHPNTGEQAQILLIHMLIEAIRYNQPDSVKFALKHFDREGLGGFMEPLPVAIMTSFLIDYNDDIEREKNLDIIHQLVEDENINLKADRFLALEPMALASIAGLLGVVKKLHEKGIPLLIMEREKVLGTDITYLDLARFQSFSHLAEYYETKIKKLGETVAPDACSKVFLH